ncbi:hypothetical protein D5R40_15125 [Okeania hirsuta]|uniref:Uncharacterized protein n=1 Tax=Okeania hirsuta TaxID=1458930 RepID=A0A3N6PUY1_9CYAN|nr:hypothetical protein D4Z78_12670 [Okeania hirsuta]RQH42192.1 hypothetical protein D5R40_15125 [Okeania hirsuta]
MILFNISNKWPPSAYAKADSLLTNLDVKLCKKAIMLSNANGILLYNADTNTVLKQIFKDHSKLEKLSG